MKARIFSISILIWFLAGISYLYAGPVERWYNSHTGVTIYTEYFNNGMEVKGLYQKNSIAWFKRKQNNIFKDNRGNTLRLINDRLVFSDKRKRAKLTFISIPQHEISNIKNPASISDSDNHLIPTNQDNTATLKPSNMANTSVIAANSITDDYIVQNNDVNHEKMEGTWAVRSMDKKVFITETREGIKARFTDELKWFEYTQIEGTDRFTNDNEAQYIRDKDMLIWKDKTGKTFSLYKISDDLED